jgi:alpha-acetolactate decarboxylase
MNRLNFKTGLFAIMLLSIGTTCFSQSHVVVYGELRAIMQRGDLSAKVLLDTLTIKEHTIGLGVAAHLKGEIVVINGKIFISSIQNGSIVSKEKDGLAAAMLVTANAEVSRDRLIGDVESIARLEQTLKVYSGSEPFAFVIDAKADEITYHVIDWKEGIVHTPDNHKQFAVIGKIVNDEVIIIGFYSDKPGTFTPHTSKIHLHVYHPRTGIVGHVENINIKKAVLEIY